MADREPYTYTDHDGDHLEIRVRPGVTHLVAVDTDGGRTAVFVRAEDCAEVAAALWPEGQAPIILDRVAINPRTGYHQHGWSVTLHEDGQLHVVTNRDFAPDDALVLAAVVAALAEDAKAGPDPAEVTRLAHRFHTEVCADDDETPARLCDCWSYAAAAVRAMAEAAETCCVCGSTQVTYHNYREQPFCPPCADGKTPAEVPA